MADDKIVIEGFMHSPQSIARRLNTWDTPQAFNHCVLYRKVRVTIEYVDEPREVLTDRLDRMFVASDHYVRCDIQSVANSLDHTLPGK